MQGGTHLQDCANTAAVHPQRDDTAKGWHNVSAGHWLLCRGLDCREQGRLKISASVCRPVGEANTHVVIIVPAVMMDNPLFCCCCVLLTSPYLMICQLSTGDPCANHLISPVTCMAATSPDMTI